MNPLLARPFSRLLSLTAQTAPAAPVRWERPPSGTLQRGWVWVPWPGLLLVTAAIVAAVILGLALRARMRRRRNG